MISKEDGERRKKGRNLEKGWGFKYFFGGPRGRRRRPPESGGTSQSSMESLGIWLPLAANFRSQVIRGSSLGIPARAGMIGLG